MEATISDAWGAPRPVPWRRGRWWSGGVGAEARSFKPTGSCSSRIPAVALLSSLWFLLLLSSNLCCVCVCHLRYWYLVCCCSPPLTTSWVVRMFPQTAATWGPPISFPSYPVVLLCFPSLLFAHFVPPTSWPKHVFGPNQTRFLDLSYSCLPLMPPVHAISAQSTQYRATSPIKPNQDPINAINPINPIKPIQPEEAQSGPNQRFTPVF